MFSIVRSILHIIIVITPKNIMFELSSTFRRTWDMLKTVLFNQRSLKEIMLNNAWNSPY